MSGIRHLFARQLKKLRHERDMTQEDLATAAGLSASFIRSMEQGVHAPSFESIEALSRALRVPPSTLFEFPTDLHANGVDNR